MSSAEKLLDEGAALHRKGRSAEAMDRYRKALALDSTLDGAWVNLGVLLRSQKKWEAAAACYRRALFLNPSAPATHNNMANVLRDMGRFEESEVQYRKALDLNPDYDGAAYGLGMVLRDMGRLEDSLKYLEKSVAAEPENPDRQWDRALTLLRMGDFERGWEAHESRWNLPRAVRPNLDKPEWDGGSFKGKTLLLYGEQGFGDVIQFVRFVKEAARKGGEVVLWVRPELLRLLAGVAAVAPRDAPPPPHDLVLPLMSLPKVLGTTLETLPPAPYLKVPDRGLTPPVPPGAKFKVAVVWAGSPTHDNDRNRSCSLEHFLTLTGNPAVAWYSLQKGPRAGDLEKTGALALMKDLGPSLTSFADTAEVLVQMDLLICVDTSVAHLAGALGVPVWVLSPLACDWRWGRSGESTPWYPSMRLFRQEKQGDWEGLFPKVAEALEDFVRSSLGEGE